MADSTKPPEDDLTRVRRRVAEMRGEGASSNPPPDSAASLALKFGGEFGAAVVVGALIGYGIDYWAHTKGVALAIGVGLGFCAGVVNVVRTAQAYSRANPADPNAPVVRDDEEE
jgi:ATP synthase protein I